MAENKWLDRDVSDIEGHPAVVGIRSVALKSEEHEDEEEEEHVPHGTEVAEAAFKLEAPDFDDAFPSSTPDSEDQKLAAREEPKHSLDDLVANDEETKRSLEDLEHGRLDTHLFSLDDGEEPPSRRARTFHPSIAPLPSHDHANQFHMSMNFPPYASPVSHSAPYQHQRYEYPAYASLPPPYPSSPPAGYPTSHPYPHMIDHPLAHPHPMHHHMAHYSHPGASGYASSSPARTVNTASGENPRELPFRGPSADELEAARTARARSALHTWYQRLEELFRYKQANGNCNVPQKYEENRELGIWVNKQRMEKKAFEENKKTSMTERKILVLERIGFEWAKRKGQAAWDEKFQELLEYKRVHGNCDVPTKCRDNQALGRWVSTQRSNYKEFMEGTDTSKQMTEERIARLESVGFKWRMMSN